MRPALLHALWLPAVTLPCPGLHCCRSYLIALAVGHLESRKVGPRTHVWAEPEVVDAAAYEFGETENYIATAEAIAGEYVWGTYDILCLPPSFPYGGALPLCRCLALHHVCAHAILPP